MRFRRTNPDDLPQLKALWALGFGDTEQEIEAFFAISYPTATGFCAEEDGRLVAAAYALPQELAWGDKTCRSAYLYAVTTHPEFRRQGICAKLLAHDTNGPYHCLIKAIENDIAAGRVRADVNPVALASVSMAVWTGLVRSKIEKFLECDLEQTLRETYGAMWESVKV